MTRQRTGPLSMKNTIAMLLVCQIQSNECVYICHLINDILGLLLLAISTGQWIYCKVRMKRYSEADIWCQARPLE